MAEEEPIMSFVKKIAVEQNYQNFDIKITPINSGGANYTSKLYLVTICDKDKDDLKLFAKIACTSQEIRDAMPMDLYYTERVVYTDLLKVYRHLEEKHGVSEQHRLKFPKYYGADATQLQEIVVLEDLTSRGFSSANRFESVDWQYASAAVTELSKFHALSMAYQHEYPSKFDKAIANFPSGLFGKNDSNPIFDNCVKSALAATREENKGKLKSFLDNGSKITNTDDMFHVLRRKVLVHADFRPSNMLHRKRDDGTTEVVPVDYQTTQGGCPVTDLLYFIFTATDGQFRARHYQQLVDHYYSELGAALARLGLDVEDEYPRKDFEFEMKEKLFYGLLLSVIILPVVTVPADKAPVLNDMITDNFTIPTTGELYFTRINEAVDDYVAWGII